MTILLSLSLSFLPFASNSKNIHNGKRKRCHCLPKLRSYQVHSGSSPFSRSTILESTSDVNFRYISRMDSEKIMEKTVCPYQLSTPKSSDGTGKLNGSILVLRKELTISTFSLVFLHLFRSVPLRLHLLVIQWRASSRGIQGLWETRGKGLSRYSMLIFEIVPN